MQILKRIDNIEIMRQCRYAANGPRAEEVRSIGDEL
jgi:ribosomal protein L40E